jgi:hypothetical protein
MPPWASPSRFDASSSSQPEWKPASAKVSDVPNVAIKSAYLTEPSAQNRSTLIVLKGGSAYVAADYWVDSGKMHFVTQGGEERLFPVEKLDLSQTVRMNRERNVEFQVRSKGVVEQ